MAGVALLARAAGHRVTGSDQGLYPPMSTQLAEAGIPVREGYSPDHLRPAPDAVVIGNALSRGNPAVEHVLDAGLPYVSGPQWLAENVLAGRWVLAVAGTHGKTTTSSMLAWILEYAEMAPGFLIGGVPENFGVSARLGATPFFVVEADEYDTAFFDKRSKFIHYQPRTAILNNLEFDHADIFDDLAAIQRQFHHLVRTIPGEGEIILPAADAPLAEVLAEGCWTPVQRTGIGPDATDQADWQARLLADDGSAFAVYHRGENVGQVHWEQTGEHSVMNGLAAMAAAHHVGVLPVHAADALSAFSGVKRRMQVVGDAKGLRLYDDFAHHPTAIATTLAGLRARVGDAPILAVIEPRSNTMRLGVHKARLADSVQLADQVCWYQPAGLDWQLHEVAANAQARVYDSVDAIIAAVETFAAQLDGRPGHVLIMSNGGFEGIHGRMLAALSAD